MDRIGWGFRIPGSLKNPPDLVSGLHPLGQQ
ncbi:MAG: hypothetical protein JG766_864, partial [Desulfacinum sp.]|nr:hypothetical protein [Desulfacinum sp.]